VKRENHIGPSLTGQRAVGTGLSLDSPANLAESGKYGAELSWRASCSRGVEGDAEEFRRGLVMFQAVRNDTEGQGLDLSDGLFPRRAIRQHTGQVRHLGNPTPVNFARCSSRIKLRSSD
jgi:hypothetical protein